MSTQLQAPTPSPTPKPAAVPVSSNGGPPDDEKSVRDLVRAHLDESDGADPVAVVDAVLAELSPDQLYAAARAGLERIAHHLARQDRRPPSQSGGSSRWDNVADAEKEHRDVLMERVCIVQGNQHKASVWKFLGDCTASDLAGAEAIKRELAAGAIASVKAYQRLRTELKSPRQKVKSLGGSRVREILYA